MRHAYMILAHGGWSQLERLLTLLDDPDNDVYVHIDRKARDCPVDRLRAAAERSRVAVCSEYSIHWGCYEMVEAELLLLEQARRTGYDYYHLISGADLPLKPQREIHAFFEQNRGREFVQFASDAAREGNPEIARRTRLYHPLQRFRRGFRRPLLNRMAVLADRAQMAAQLVLGVNRMKKHPGLEIRYGSQWFSITDGLAALVTAQRPMIREVFRCTNCADELFVQTIVHHSEFRGRLYHPAYDGSCLANQRYIDWSGGQNGSPRTFRMADFDAIASSGCLFARKFSMDADPALFDRICALSE